VSYVKDTSACFLSDEAYVLSYTGNTSRLCSVKQIFSDDLIVYVFSTNLAKGNIG